MSTPTPFRFLLAACLTCLALVPACAIRTELNVPTVRVGLREAIANYQFSAAEKGAQLELSYELTSSSGRRLVAVAREERRLDSSGQLKLHPMVVTLDGRQLTEAEALAWVQGLAPTLQHGEVERLDLLNAMKRYRVATPGTEPTAAAAPLAVAGSRR